MSTLLVAEDDQHIRELLVDTLFDAGYDVIEAEDGAVALEKACREHPDLVLLDVWMPAMDGFQVLGKLREYPATQSIPVIMLTALPAAQGEREGMRLGATHYINKPWAPGMVEATVRVALREAAPEAGPAGEDRPAWSSSISYRRTPDGPGPNKSIGTVGHLARLEQILGGGIPLSTLTLVDGSSATAKSILCQHLTYGALEGGYGAAYLTSQFTPQSLVAQMRSLGLDVSGYRRNKKLGIYPLPETGPDGVSGVMLSKLSQDIERLPKKYELIVVDDITSLAVGSQAQEVIGFFASCKRLCSKSGTIVVVAQPYAFDDNTLLRLRSLCDSNLRLHSGNLGAKDLRTLRVAKANNVELSRNNSLTFQVEAGVGIRVMPMSSVPA